MTFFPMHQMRILGMPRRYFSYGEVYTNLNIITFVRTLFTVLRWLVLIVMMYNVIVAKVGIGRYVAYADSVYRSNLPHHTYMSSILAWWNGYVPKKVEKKIKEVIVSERGKIVRDKLEKEFPGYGIRKRMKDISKELSK